MRQTIAQRTISEMEQAGYKLIGRTSGWFSFRKGSNLSRKLDELGKTQEDVEVRTGARAGKNKTEGYELLIFSK